MYSVKHGLERVVCEGVHRQRPPPTSAKTERCGARSPAFQFTPTVNARSLGYRESPGYFSASPGLHPARLAIPFFMHAFQTRRQYSFTVEIPDNLLVIVPAHHRQPADSGA